MRFNCFFSLFFLLTSLFAEEKGEIRVHLTTHSPLSPLYLSFQEAPSDGCPLPYLKRLQTVLEFDLKHSGYFTLLKRQEAKESLLSEKNSQTAFNLRQWKEWGIAYVVKGTVAKNKLRLLALDVPSLSLKQFEEIPISGDLRKDRREMHKLSDALLKTLLKKEGVASTRLLFSCQVKNPEQNAQKWLAEIWECDWDGANARPVTKDKSYNISPLFVPSKGKNDHFLYVSYQLSQPKIYLSSLSAPRMNRFLSLKGNQLLPALSLERKQAAFICDAAGRPDLFVQQLNTEGKEKGKAVQLFSYPHSTQASPTFSPDGSKIAFVSDKDGSPRIYLIPSTRNTRRHDAKLLTRRNPESSCPNWAPDGSKIAYSAKTEGIRQIWLFDCIKEEEIQLTFGSGNKENPFWAPDSLHLVFNSTDSDSSELYAVNLNQPEAVKITCGPGKKHYPAWGKR